MKKKTNHKIMKKRNTKRNTKRKINKKYRSFKRRKTFKRNKKIRFTRKKLYGGDPERIKGLIVTIMSIGPMNFLSDGTNFSRDKKFENLYSSKTYEHLRNREGFWKKLRFPRTDSTLDEGLYPLFRFWHKYGCVLSDNTLYKLYINAFFHSIYSQIASEQDDSEAGSKELYDRIIQSYPVTRELAIVFYKLKHLYDDLKAGDLDGAKILNFVQYILEILTNIIILKHFGFSFRNKEFKFLGLLERTPDFIKNIVSIVPLLSEYIDSGIFSEYIQRDYDGFNAAIATAPVEFHLEGYQYAYALDHLKRNLEGTGDPILELNKGDTHPNTPAGAAAGAGAAAEAMPPEPAPAPSPK